MKIGILNFDISNLEEFPFDKKLNMIYRMLYASEKLRNHLLNCKDISSCDVEKRINFFLRCFLKFEKEIDIPKIMEEITDDCILSDKYCKFFK